MEATHTKYGYCHIIIQPQTAQKLLRTNSERAFVISQLQDLLSPRMLIGDIPAHRQLASCIDLLAFSITAPAIHCIVFTIDFTIAKDFAHRIALRLAQYQSDCAPSGLKKGLESQVLLRILNGPHHALSRSISLHLIHQDWEYDRYSSIGFYLHDRRGDWMRVWRLASLYDNEPERYYELIRGYRSTWHDELSEPSPTQLVPFLAS